MQFRRIRPLWCINSLSFRGQLLWQRKLQNHGELLYRIIYFFHIFSRPFDLAKGYSVVEMLSRGKTVMVPWGKMACWRENGTVWFWTLTARMNYVAARLNVTKYNHLHIFHIFTPFWLRPGQCIQATWCISSIRNPKGPNGALNVGAKWHFFEAKWNRGAGQNGIL